jgi:hypothetical protein
MKIELKAVAIAAAFYLSGKACNFSTGKFCSNCFFMIIIINIQAILPAENTKNTYFIRRWLRAKTVEKDNPVVSCVKHVSNKSRYKLV